MNKIVHYIGLDVHKDSIAVSSADIRTVQELLGHEDVSTTMIYTHVLRTGGNGMKSPLDCL